ncbi:TIGR02611 family protein [Catellatospora sp. NPDC049609]|uniref:TIGR02611 family protein n=1 Tax=Catellatospora sp. NPDC049609 TaxID=3155505 RepID=UPI00342C0042
MSDKPDFPQGSSRWRDRARIAHQTVRANPTGAAALKVVIGALGGLVVAIGILLIPLPGPGWLIVIGGLAIWAVEFVWARHLLQFTKDKVHGWTEWIKRQHLAVRLLIGLAGLVFVAAVLYTTLRYSLGIDVVSQAWQYVNTR